MFKATGDTGRINVYTYRKSRSGVNVIKLFFFVTNIMRNKLEGCPLTYLEPYLTTLIFFVTYKLGPIGWGVCPLTSLFSLV
jgi:hypothetical protein